MREQRKSKSGREGLPSACMPKEEGRHKASLHLVSKICFPWTFLNPSKTEFSDGNSFEVASVEGFVEIFLDVAAAGSSIDIFGTYR